MLKFIEDVNLSILLMQDRKEINPQLIRSYYRFVIIDSLLLYLSHMRNHFELLVSPKLKNLESVEVRR